LITVRIALVAVLLGFAPAALSAQDEALRGLFLQTRPPINQKPRPQTAAPTQMALGYTLLLRSAFTEPVRVSSSHSFNEGDGIRILIESSADGYLYLFNREGNGPLRMIFPDPRIRRGQNRLPAHVPLIVPPEPAAAAGSSAGWFVFSGPPEPERLFLVFSREPVRGWPHGDELLAYTGGFQLSWELFRQSTAAEAQDVLLRAKRNEGQVLSPGELTSVSRGLTLSRKDPPPSVIRVSKHPRAQQLVSEIELRRR